MNITSKSRYALKIITDLAHHDGQIVRRKDLAARQGIPEAYLDQIMIPLRRKGFVNSTRGCMGGYQIARPSKSISVWDLFNATEDHFLPVDCAEDSKACDFSNGCITQTSWQQIISAMKSTLSSITLDNLTKDQIQNHHLCPIGGVQECSNSRRTQTRETTLHG